MRSRACSVGLLLALASVAGAQPPVVHHALDVTLDPDRARLEVVDRIELPAAMIRDGRVVVRINAGFELRGLEGARVEAREIGSRVQALTLGLRDGGDGVRIRYAGTPVLGASGDGPAEWLDAEGAHLGHASAWYPRLRDGLHAYELTLRLPQGWHGLVSGRTRALADESAVRWRSERPVEAIDLVAGPFERFRRDGAWGTAAVWLRAGEPRLAATYLDAIAHHLPFYSELIGPYPYSRFTVVENLRQTGWGMPGFTLLGSRVMRLPFIPHTSLPHELLHNWWGNGVLVDQREGNWSEGLTAYLADHLVAERRGQGARHRRDALARLRAAAGEGADTAPVTFTARHDRRSQAVGYDKPLMIFHMARRARGDEAFVAGLRELFAGGLGRRVGAREVLAALVPAGEDWFARWWARPGAPALALDCCAVSVRGQGFRVRGSIRQVHDGAPFALQVPVQILLAGEAVAREHRVEVRGERTSFELAVPGRPLAVQMDAAYDTLRIPQPGELPPALGELLAAPTPVAVLAPGLREDVAAGYRALARRVGARLVAVEQAAEARALWVLGARSPAAAPWHEAFARAVPEGDSRVMVVRDARGRPRALVDAASAAAAAALARRLPHYGRYGRLGFTGPSARNVFKGQAEVTDAPGRVVLDPRMEGRAVPVGARAPLTAVKEP